MYWIPILAIGSYLLLKNTNEKKPRKKTYNMANCNKLFKDYNVNLTIKSAKKDRLKESKRVLRDRIRKYFKDNHPEYVPEFYIQGSYKMKTTIVTKDDDCDLDDGVYFKREVGVTGTTLQKWVKDAVTGATSADPQHRKRCVRVIYAADYHIDFPVYYFQEDWEHPRLAVKDEELQESDPKEVIDWFAGAKDENGQLVRVVKFLKGWGDFKRNKMPSGLAMCILAEKNIKYNDRDDISIKETLETIKTTLNNSFECIVPGTPYDDLFSDYDDSRKNNFLSNLDDFIKDATKAVEDEPNQLKSSKLWRKHFGDKFPLGADEDVDAKEKALLAQSASILSGTAHTKRDGSISDSGSVKNKPHTNYGGK
ncbi:CBASS cGAMP synthase [Lacinutrix salivirga]